ncbi:hypothetical protein KJ756_02010 [Patescibacteria group bacterium]|nr:hypothetical protein [Patescibacteria group bacterium]MBU4030908.1 hypothetical protein [Patescibacteria group bacterium]MBU4082372.1 hypothetical protein [Patescibacteria group bacterium]MCG2808852.1 hypothetical protein [Candidatus Portnoybacteria bacterium]
MEQCLHCAGYLFFKPLPDETFACCQKHDENIKDINLKTGASPAIEKHGLKGVLCKKFKPGKSICCTSEVTPFLLHPARVEGEKELSALM